MQITTSVKRERAFATTQRELSVPLRYTVTASSDYGTCHHAFVDLDSAIAKIRELVVLGIHDLSIKRSTCHNPGE